MKKVFGLAAVAISLAACATVPEDSAIAADAAQPIYCFRGADCDEKWSRALAWVVSNSKTKVQLQNDTLIQTYTPNNSAATSYTVMRTSVGGGRYQIVLNAGCPNPFACIPNPTQQKADFVRYVDGY